ncbi:hypothetical protein, partial [Shigella flexneri]|uniref:hypothetical protein n=1 Tax=Shigella flexneri TaxID=623 RepID=UPI0020927502
MIKTDVAVSIPEGYVGLLTSRSGVSSKTHLVIETGKIDAGYHGNLGINIKNDNETLESEDMSNFGRSPSGIDGKYTLLP